VNEAIRVGDESIVERELADLTSHFDAATRALQNATALVK